MKAFPALRTEQYQDVDGNWRTKADDGMDLRDYFAAKALQGLLTTVKDEQWLPQDVAEVCYEVADSMMKAREK
jgi:hypothetical protein